jgi:ferric-dicitrate binding protein FerR (iron transport regulator)
LRCPEEADVATERPTANHPQHEQAAQQIAEAHQILKNIEQHSDKHSTAHEAMVEAIEKLEMALAILSVKTGGML